MKKKIALRLAAIGVGIVLLTSAYTRIHSASIMSDAAKAAALKHFVAWVLTEGQKKANNLDYPAMPQSILDKALAVVNT